MPPPLAAGTTRPPDREQEQDNRSSRVHTVSVRMVGVGWPPGENDRCQGVLGCLAATECTVFVAKNLAEIAVSVWPDPPVGPAPEEQVSRSNPYLSSLA
jgi:hypothetical protein